MLYDGAGRQWDHELVRLFVDRVLPGQSGQLKAVV